MYLIYLDESGTPNVADSDPYYLLAGMVVAERDWKVLDMTTDFLKNTHGINEIHTRKIYKRYRKHGNTNNLKILSDIYDHISSLRVKLICTGVYKPTNSDIDIEYKAWELMVERLNIIVDKWCQEDGVNEYGLIIMDEKNYQKDVRIKNHIRLMRQSKITKQFINRIIEDPVFTPSHWRNLIQLSDSTVYCCKKYLTEDPFFISQFNIIKEKFSKNKDSIWGAGFKIWY